ncbi:MAG TPA: 7-cyano-7-deazaguanine synthase QueC [Acidobacteriota bacterium]|nr:7-cyano-7-deazaguanine synthase QueC [Acidobacteriota bacterium]
MKRKAVVLLSGGLDSATTMAVANSRGFSCFALTIDYGQRHGLEIEAARRLAKSLEAERHLVLSYDLRPIGGSALTDDIEVPKGGLSEAIPVTYVPARNTLLLSLALAWAEVLGAYDIFIGANAVDYSGNPDCRPKFIDAFTRLANVATAAAVEGRGRFTIHAPLIKMKKSEIILTGLGLGLDYSLTASCYDPATDGRACGRCDSCRLRLKGFEEAGVKDPISYSR